MSNIVIKVENISKIYDLGLVGTGTLSKDLNRAWAKLRGKPDPYATLAELNDRTKKSKTGTVYALKDIDFSVQKGEVLGIIGKNGAGKSTLLKILSQITSPTMGNVKIKGRVASLLEVGTGMHPEMTARQNIYLNGSIMGMRRHEITSKLDEIVDFAGIAKYVDTPIKRFSSGMQVRLGFAVAAFLEPEILIVDEVLAVGDAEFQKKAIGKMQNVSKGEGRTVLFVSHNMAAVKSLCSKSILIENGSLKFMGITNEVVAKYLVGSNDINNFKDVYFGDEHFNVSNILVKSKHKSYLEPISREDIIEIHIGYNNKSDNTIAFTLKMKGDDGQYCLTTDSSHFPNLITKGSHFAIMEFPAYLLNEGDFYIDLYVVKDLRTVFIKESDAVSFVVNPEPKPIGSWMGKELGYFRGNFQWKNINK